MTGQNQSPLNVQDFRFRVVNSGSSPLIFHLEPWGDEVSMSPGFSLDVLARGPQGEGKILEVVVSGDSVTVYGWSGSLVRLFRGTTEIGGEQSQGNPAPE